MPDAPLLPAHGPVTGSAHDRVDELLVHHEKRLEDTQRRRGRRRHRLRGGPLAGWTRRERHFDELDLFNQLLAINETVAHLVVLSSAAG